MLCQYNSFYWNTTNQCQRCPNDTIRIQMSQFYCNCNQSIENSYHYISNTYTECIECPEQSYVVQSIYTKQQMCQCRNNYKYYQYYNKCDTNCQQVYSIDQICINCSTFKLNSTHCSCENGYFDVILQRCIQCQQIFDQTSQTCNCGQYSTFNPYTQKCQQNCENQVQTVNSTCVDCPNGELFIIQTPNHEWPNYCSCDEFQTVYNYYENQCFDCNTVQLQSMITTCQCGSQHTFNKQNLQCQQNCNNNQIRINDQCFDCPNNTISIDYQTCNCQNINTEYQYIQQYNICSVCPQYSTYVSKTQTCQCPDNTQLLQDEQTFKLYCDINCDGDDPEILKELYKQGYCQCSQTQFYNISEFLCFDCPQNSIQANTNRSCNCTQQEKIWNYNNQCVQCPENAIQNLIQQSCNCQYENINQTYNYYFNRCDLNCSMSEQILNPITKICQSCPDDSQIDIQQDTCICNQIEQYQYMYDQYTGNNKCILCKYGISEINNQCLCEYDQFTYNIYRNQCILSCKQDYNQFISSYTKNCEVCPGKIDENNTYICTCEDYDYLDIQYLLCRNCTGNSTYNQQLQVCQCNTYFIQHGNECQLNCESNTITYKQNYCYKCSNDSIANNDQCICQDQQYNYNYAQSKCITCPKDSIFNETSTQCVCNKEKYLVLSEDGQQCEFKCKDNEIKSEKNHTCHYCGEDILIKRGYCWCKTGYLYNYDKQLCITQQKQLIIIGCCLVFLIILTIFLSCCVYNCYSEKQNKIKDIDGKETLKQKIENWKIDNKSKRLAKKQETMLKREQIKQQMIQTIQSNRIERPKKHNESQQKHKHRKHQKSKQ